MSFPKLFYRRFSGSLAILLIFATLFVVAFKIQSTDAQSSTPLPVVAIHVSLDTEDHWTSSAWTYFSLYEMLEEALRSDGTPFVEISDSDIEAGDLLSSGSPKYPIIFSLATECISDAAANQIAAYVNAGGFVYVSSSSWTKYPDGSSRTDFALAAQMGIECTSSPPGNWAQVTSITTTETNRLVDHVPQGVTLNWQLPLTNTTLGYRDTSSHYVWKTQPTLADPAQVLITTSSYIILATKAYSNGRFIYHSELAPLAGFSILGPDMYEYLFFRKAIEWAFETQDVPLAKLSPWPYQYNSAFIIRHDMCHAGATSGYGWMTWINGSAQAEKDLGVAGEYYITTGEVRDPLACDPYTPEQLIAHIQSAEALGALIGSHAGGLSSTPWTGISDPKEGHFYHWGPDEGIRFYPQNLTYTELTLNISLNDLQGWLGERPQTYVSPEFNGALEQSLEFFESLGIKTADGQYIGPYPHFGLSMGTKNKHYDVLVLPTSEWYTSSGILQRMENFQETTMRSTVDLYYDCSALVNIYGHQPAYTALCTAYITYCKSKPYMWTATSPQIRDWWLVRQPVTTSTSYAELPNGEHNLTLAISGSTSPDVALEIDLPVKKCQIYDLKVELDGTPSTDFRWISSGIKVKTGIASRVSVTWKEIDCWTQTSQADFESGVLTNLDTSSVPDQVSLSQSSGTIFSDDFSDANWTNSHWTVHSGNWTVSEGIYRQTNSSDGPSLTYAGDTSWSNYAIEARARFIDGRFGACLTGRLNPVTGSRYSLYTYPSTEYGGPNKARLLKVSDYASSGLWTLGIANITADTNWHKLKLEFSGSTINCYYDDSLIITATDSSYTVGAVDLETWQYSTVEFDWVAVSGIAYQPVGTLLSSPFDAGSNVIWLNVSWTSFTPTGTAIKFRTRTAFTEAALNTATWSDYYTISGSSITSPPNRWIQYEATFSTNDVLSTPTLYDVSVCYTSLSTRLYIDPPLIEKTFSDIGTSFDINVTIGDIEDLQGFDLNLTWDNNLITLTNVDVQTALDNVWGPDNWFLAYNSTGPGFFKLAAVSTSTSYTSINDTPLARLTFQVQGPICNSIRQAPVHFETHKLSNSQWTAITHIVDDGLYRITGKTPKLQLDPTNVMCRKYNESFTIEIKVSNACNVEDFDFEIHYNTTLLTCSSVTWNSWTLGTIVLDESNGNVTGHNSGDPVSGTTTLVTIKFTADYYHIWKSAPGWQNDLAGEVYFEWANLSYFDAPDLAYQKDGLGQIEVGPDVLYTFSPIQGDVDNNGNVNIFDLRTVAYYYDVEVSSPNWAEASKYNLNADNIIDILDLVLVAVNYGFTYP